MSTRIQDDTATSDSLDVIGLEDSVEFRAIEVRGRNKSSHTWVSVRTTDLIDALRVEGILPAEAETLAEWERDLLYPDLKRVPADAIVILRETLPEVVYSDADPRYVRAGGIGVLVESDAAAVRANGLARLALAEYLDANPPKPPVDEAMVRQITATLTNPHTQQRDDESGTQYARRLYLAGVRIEAAL